MEACKRKNILLPDVCSQCIDWNSAFNISATLKQADPRLLTNCKDYNGRPLLTAMYLTEYDDFDRNYPILRAFLNNDVTVDLKDSLDQTIVYYMIEKYDYKALKILFQKQNATNCEVSNLNIYNKSGYSPLYQAIQKDFDKTKSNNVVTNDTIVRNKLDEIEFSDSWQNDVMDAVNSGCMLHETAMNIIKFKLVSDLMDQCNLAQMQRDEIINSLTMDQEMELNIKEFGANGKYYEYFKPIAYEQKHDDEIHVNQSGLYQKQINTMKTEELAKIDQFGKRSSELKKNKQMLLAEAANLSEDIFSPLTPKKILLYPLLLLNGANINCSVLGNSNKLSALAFVLSTYFDSNRYHLFMIQDLLDKGAVLYAEELNILTSLFITAAAKNRNDFEIYLITLEKVAEKSKISMQNVKDRLCNNPIHLFILHQNMTKKNKLDYHGLKILTRLCQRYPVWMKAVNANGDCPLDLAVKYKDVDATFCIMFHLAKFDFESLFVMMKERKFVYNLIKWCSTGILVNSLKQKAAKHKADTMKKDKKNEKQLKKHTVPKGDFVAMMRIFLNVFGYTAGLCWPNKMSKNKMLEPISLITEINKKRRRAKKAIFDILLNECDIASQLSTSELNLIQETKQQDKDDDSEEEFDEEEEKRKNEQRKNAKDNGDGAGNDKNEEENIEDQHIASLFNDMAMLPGMNISVEQKEEEKIENGTSQPDMPYHIDAIYEYDEKQIDLNAEDDDEDENVSQKEAVDWIELVYSMAVESFSTADLITDLIIVKDLYENEQQWWTSWMMFFLVSPYLVSYSALGSMIQHRITAYFLETIDNTQFTHKCRLFIINLMTLLLMTPLCIVYFVIIDVVFMIYVILSTVIFLITFTAVDIRNFIDDIIFKKIFAMNRTQIVGYRRLRTLSQLLFESFPQIILQLRILWIIKLSKKPDSELSFNINEETIMWSVVFAILHCILEGVIIYLDSKALKISFTKYAIICLGGRIGWFPYNHLILKYMKNGHDYDKDKNTKKEMIVFNYDNIDSELFSCFRYKLDYNFSNESINTFSQTLGSILPSKLSSEYYSSNLLNPMIERLLKHDMLLLTIQLGECIRDIDIFTLSEFYQSTVNKVHVNVDNVKIKKRWSSTKKKQRVVKSLIYSGLIECIKWLTYATNSSILSNDEQLEIEQEILKNSLKPRSDVAHLQFDILKNCYARNFMIGLNCKSMKIIIRYLNYYISKAKEDHSYYFVIIFVLFYTRCNIFHHKCSLGCCSFQHNFFDNIRRYLPKYIQFSPGAEVTIDMETKENNYDDENKEIETAEINEDETPQVTIPFDIFDCCDVFNPYLEELIIDSCKECILSNHDFEEEKIVELQLDKKQWKSNVLETFLSKISQKYVDKLHDIITATNDENVEFLSKEDIKMINNIVFMLEIYEEYNLYLRRTLQFGHDFYRIKSPKIVDMKNKKTVNILLPELDYKVSGEKNLQIKILKIKLNNFVVNNYEQKLDENQEEKQKESFVIHCRIYFIYKEWNKILLFDNDVSANAKQIELNLSDKASGLAYYNRHVLDQNYYQNENVENNENEEKIKPITIEFTTISNEITMELESITLFYDLIKLNIDENLCGIISLEKNTDFMSEAMELYGVNYYKQPKDEEMEEDMLKDQRDELKKNGTIVLFNGSSNLLVEECHHIHLSTQKLTLLLGGYLRSEIKIEQKIDNKRALEFFKEVYKDCSNYLNILTKIKKQEFEVGTWYQGCECQVNEMKLKSENSKHSIHMEFIYENNDLYNFEDDDEDDEVLQLRFVWLSYDGEDKDYTHLYGNKTSKLKATETLKQQTYCTHPWKLYHKKYFLGCYVPTSPIALHRIKISNYADAMDNMIVTCHS